MSGCRARVEGRSEEAGEQWRLARVCWLGLADVVEGFKESEDKLTSSWIAR